MDDETINEMLKEATRTLRPGKLLAFSRTILKVRRNSDRHGRRYPPMDQYQERLDEIARLLGRDLEK